VSRSWRLGRFVVYLDSARRDFGWIGANTNSPFLWRLLVGPLAFTWLRENWSRPIILPRNLRRRLTRGKAVNVAGLEHRRAR